MRSPGSGGGVRSFGGEGMRSIGGMGQAHGLSGPNLSGRNLSGPLGGNVQNFSQHGGLREIGPRASSNLFKGEQLGHRELGERREFAEHHEEHHGDFDHFHHGFFPWWAWWSPGWGWGWGGGDWGYPGYDYGYGYSEPYSYGVASVPYDQPVTTDTTTSSDFFTQALAAFRAGNYQEALRLAGHASIDMRNDARPHELASLALFALAEYRGAAMEAHAALSLGQPADWATLYSYYNDLPTYQRQLDALTNYAGQHSDSVDAKFLLAYHNLMMGHRDLAQQQLGDVVKAAPHDQLAARLLESIGGKAPTLAPGAGK